MTAALLVTAGPVTSARAAATLTIANWQMNEGAGATVMLDTSGNGINGAVGSAIQTGFIDGTTTGYQWPSTAPNAPPPKPERLIQVANSQLNPGTRDYAITMRFRTTHNFGNMIQKGQSQTPGGYFKWQIPQGVLSCLFRGVSTSGNVVQKSVSSGTNLLNDGVWHTVRCERTATRVTMTIDGTITRTANGATGSISNTIPLTIGGKLNCDQVEITCDYFAGQIDFVRIEVSSNAPPDTVPPTAPGKPSGVSNSFDSVDLTWAGSTDAVSPSLTYRVYRDGLLAGSTTTTSSTVTFTDTGLAPGSTHTYSVEALDGAQNVSVMSPLSDPITVQPIPSVILTDDFSSGLGGWTVTRVTLDPTTGSLSAPSARVQVTGLSAFAEKILSFPFSSLCLGANVNETQFGANNLLRFKTAADGPVARVMLDSGGSLRFRSDVTLIQSAALAQLGAGWHAIEMCGTVGTAGTWDVYLDGVKILDQWVANTGTTPIGRVSFGDTTAKTWTANFDDIVVEQTFGGGPPPPPDTDPPSTPGTPTGVSDSSSTVDVTWAGSTDVVSPSLTYRVYRDGVLAGSTTTAAPTVTFTDTGLAAGSTHTYSVEAVDAAQNVSPMSPTSDPIVVQDVPPGILFDDFSGGLGNWTVTRVTLDNTSGSPSAPSARVQVAGLSAFAQKILTTTYSSLCLGANVNETQFAANILLRLKTAADGPVARIVLDANRFLRFRADVSGIQSAPLAQLTAGWHAIEFCGTVGTAGTWDVYLDGVKILDQWVANTGTTPIGMVGFGDTSAKTWTANFDDVIVEETFGTRSAFTGL
jgi:hypothetical protein